MGKIIQFPKIVKIKSLTNEGVFTLTLDNIKEVRLYEASILIWFWEDAENGRPWDLTLEYASPQEAEDSYNDMLSVLREIRFKQANNVHRISTTDKED